MNFPVGQNIAVLASYRTGSTAFCDIIARNYNITNFDEAFHPAKPGYWMDRFKDCVYVVKIMPDHFVHPGVELVVKNSFVVGITRRDVCAQIASFYICHMTKHWHYYKSQNVKQYSVPIDRNELEDQWRYIMTMNSRYQDLAAQHCQQVFCYEDLQPDLARSKFDQYHRPDNYDQIYQAVAELLQ